MFGGLLKVVLVLVVRVLQGRQRLQGGIGLSPRRRLALPLLTAVVAVVGLGRGAIDDVSHAAGLVVATAVVAVVTGIARSFLTVIDSVPIDDLYPSGIRVTDRIAAPVVEVVGLAVTAVIAAAAVLHNGGSHTTVAVWMLSAVVLEISCYAALLVRTGALRPQLA